jgi:methylmalonyl-CoA epimerase
MSLEPDMIGDGLGGVDHVAIAVRDVDPYLAYYRDRLGLFVVHDEVLVDPPVRLLLLDAGNVRIQLVQPCGPGRVLSFIEDRGEGLHHICFLVDRIEATLLSRRLDLDGPIFLGGQGRRCCFVDDERTGVAVELMEQIAES